MSSLKMTKLNVTSRKYYLKQRGTYMLHDVIPMECERYPSKLIPKVMNVLSEVIKLHDVNLFNMAPYN